MRVLITGGSGLIGRAAAVRLIERGCDVRLIDVANDPQILGAGYARCDITRYEELLPHVRGVDAVVHLAAIRNPHDAPGHEVYRVNTIGTFNVFEAAAQTGVRRVVQASSINAVGAYYSVGDITPQYFPLDEDHPPRTTDPYSFSKQQIEEIGAYFWRRDGIRSIALRLPGVYGAGYPASMKYRERRTAAHSALDALREMPEADRRTRIDAALQAELAFRAQRGMEYPSRLSRTGGSDETDETVRRMVAHDRFNLWASIDERDAALAIECAVTADFEGSHAVYVSNPSNFWGYDSHALVEMFFPDVTTWKRVIAGSDSLVSIQRARQLIGFEPQHSLEETASA